MLKQTVGAPPKPFFTARIRVCVIAKYDSGVGAQFHTAKPSGVFVAQNCILLYRRFAVRDRCQRNDAEIAGDLPNAIRQQSASSRCQAPIADVIRLEISDATVRCVLLISAVELLHARVQDAAQGRIRRVDDLVFHPVGGDGHLVRAAGPDSRRARPARHQAVRLCRLGGGRVHFAAGLWRDGRPPRPSRQGACAGSRPPPPSS